MRNGFNIYKVQYRRGLNIRDSTKAEDDGYTKMASRMKVFLFRKFEWKNN